MMAALPLAALGASLGVWAYGTYEPNSPLFGRVIGRGPGAGRVAYLTFDDGPNPGATEPILDTLAGLGVPAGFFMVGEHVRRFPGIARRVVAAGHEVGNHTLRHPKLHFRGPRRIDAELTGAHAVIANATGRAPRSFRATGGVCDDGRSEEHTSELQSRLHLVCRLLLEKKKKNKTDNNITT